MGYSTTSVELFQDKPCYYHNGKGMTLWPGHSEWVTIWEDTASPLEGGAGMSLDMTQYSRLKIFFMSYSSSGQFEVDLTTPVPRPNSGTEPYSASGACPYWNSGSSRLETHICWVQISSDKDSIYNIYQGYCYGTNYTNRNGYADYYIYRIDAIV